MTGTEALAAATARLRTAGVESPARDARRLLAHALGLDPSRLTLVQADALPEAAAARFEAAVGARAERRPLAQITGERAFYGRAFRVTGDVLDPRAETETLVAQALEAPFDDVLDLGTGSGCLLVSLLAERPGARGLGTDTDPAALAVAETNAARHGVAGRARFATSDWYAGVGGRFDLVVANPPYLAAAELVGLAPELAWEPRGALSAGPDALAAYRAIAAGTAAHLAPGGRLLLEIGLGQAEAVAAILSEAGLVPGAPRADLDGRWRTVSAQLAGDR